MLMNCRLLELDSINYVRHIRKRKYKLPSSNQIKVYYRICTFRYVRIEIIHGSQNVFCSFNMGWRILVNFIRQPMLKLKTHSKIQNTFWLS